MGLVNIGNPQRYQETEFIANQSDLTMRFTTGTWQHTLVAGVEASVEEVGRYGYTLLNDGSPILPARRSRCSIPIPSGA